MSKMVSTFLVSTLIVAATMQMAAAAERHGRRHAPAITTPTSQLRQSNAYAPPFAARAVAPEWSRYENAAASAPAGR